MLNDVKLSLIVLETNHFKSQAVLNMINLHSLTVTRQTDLVGSQAIRWSHY